MMRIALLSDIHGNLIALESVLAELAQDAPDQIVCLGDIVEGGPQPRAVLERLQRLGCPIVMGNTDLRMSSARLDEPRRPDLSPSYAMELWCVDQLASADRAFIRTFPSIIALPLDDDISLLAFHGSPRANTDLIFATTSETELSGMLGASHATILAGGHTHVQLLRRYRDMMIVNPGSVGLPFEQPIPDGPIHRPAWAEYALVTVRRRQVSIELRRTSISIEALSKGVVTSGMPYSEQWIDEWNYP
jgi:predicted phosphodiesterase